MKRFVTAISVGLLALGVCAYAAVDWAKDYKSALQRAAKEKKKLVMVDLYADWCGPCRMLDRLTFTNADVQAALAKDFVAAKVNIEGSQENRGPGGPAQYRSDSAHCFFRLQWEETVGDRRVCSCGPIPR